MLRRANQGAGLVHNQVIACQLQDRDVIEIGLLAEHRFAVRIQLLLIHRFQAVDRLQLIPEAFHGFGGAAQQVAVRRRNIGSDCR